MKIWYENFWGGFDPNICYFNDILRLKTKIEITPHNPDLLIYGVFGNPKNVISRYDKCKKIFYASEKFLIGTNPWIKVEIKDYPCDFSISYDEESETNIQCPLWLAYLNFTNIEALACNKASTLSLVSPVARPSIAMWILANLVLPFDTALLFFSYDSIWSTIFMLPPTCYMPYLSSATAYLL